MKEISCLCAFKSFAFCNLLVQWALVQKCFFTADDLNPCCILKVYNGKGSMYLDWFGMHFPKSKMVSYRSVKSTGHTVQLLCDTEVSKAFTTEYIYSGEYRNRGSVPAVSAGAYTYTKTLYVMVWLW